MTPKRGLVPVLAATLLATSCGGTAKRPHRFHPRMVVAWQWPAPPPAYVGMPAADDHGVAATFGHHGLVLLTPTGVVRWQVDHDRLRDVAPALGSDVVVAATEGGVVAFDRATGAERWAAPLGEERPTQPVLTPELAVVLTWEGHAVAFGRADGKERWRRELRGGAMAPPVTDGTRVIAVWQGGAAAGIDALDLRSGATAWSQTLEPGGVGGPAIARSRGSSVVVVAAGDLRVHAFDTSDGGSRWVTDTAGGAGSPEVPPAAVGDDIVVADRLTGLTRLAAADGARRWTVPGPGAAVRGGPAVLAGGVVALPVDEGGLLVTAGRRPPGLYASEGRVSGLARVGALLVVATREAERNSITALRLV